MHQRGFSLIELLLVVAIILIIAAIAIPNLLTSKISANEAAAVSTLRTIDTAQVSYATAFPDVGYASELSKLGMSTDGVVSKDHGGYLDWLIGCSSQPCIKSGYKYMISESSGTPISEYVATGQPQLYGKTGKRGFCSDRLMTITYDPDGGSNCSYTLK